MKEDPLIQIVITHQHNTKYEVNKVTDS